MHDRGPESTSLFLVVAPACVGVIGLALLFNFRGVADCWYIRFSERVTGVAGGISPRTLRFFGGFFGLMGTAALVVEVVARIS